PSCGRKEKADGDPRRGAPRECGRPQDGDDPSGPAAPGPDRPGRRPRRLFLAPRVAREALARRARRRGDPEPPRVEPVAGAALRTLARPVDSPRRLAAAVRMERILHGALGPLAGRRAAPQVGIALSPGPGH